MKVNYTLDMSPFLKPANTSKRQALPAKSLIQGLVFQLFLIERLISTQKVLIGLKRTAQSRSFLNQFIQ
jgi:hypothetical protein